MVFRGKFWLLPPPDDALGPLCARSPRNAEGAKLTKSFCGRDGACQTPSNWSTRNRSFGMRHPAFTKGSALPVLTAQVWTKLPAVRHRVSCQVGRLSIDRVLVLQHEGKRQMPSRACFAKSVSAAPTPTPFQHCEAIIARIQTNQYAITKIAYYLIRTWGKTLFDAQFW